MVLVDYDEYIVVYDNDIVTIEDACFKYKDTHDAGTTVELRKGATLCRFWGACAKGYRRLKRT